MQFRSLLKKCQQKHILCNQSNQIRGNRNISYETGEVTWSSADVGWKTRNCLRGCSTLLHHCRRCGWPNKIARLTRWLKPWYTRTNRTRTCQVTLSQINDELWLLLPNEPRICDNSKANMMNERLITLQLIRDVPILQNLQPVKDKMRQAHITWLLRNATTSVSTLMKLDFIWDPTEVDGRSIRGHRAEKIVNVLQSRHMSVIFAVYNQNDCLKKTTFSFKTALLPPRLEAFYLHLTTLRHTLELSTYNCLSVPHCTIQNTHLFSLYANQLSLLGKVASGDG